MAGWATRPQQIDEMIQGRSSTLTPGDNKWKTIAEAARRDRLHAGEAGLSGLRKELARLLDMKVQVSVTKAGGQFDNGPFIPIP